MTGMIALFCEEMKRLTRHPEAYKYLLAVSGGADSSVMAALFHQAGYHFTIAHCNFHLRGEDSNQDMQLVQQMAHKWQVPIRIKEFDTFSIQKNSGLSIEMTARKLRYDWFEEIGKDFDYIVTAHQANDAAETLLLNLCRGTGLHGLTSIPEKNGKIIRPLLCFTEKEIHRYAHDKQIQYAVDYTNKDEQLKRNKIRCSVIPLLETLNPNLIHTLTRNRKIFQLQWTFIQHKMTEYRQLLLKGDNDGFTIEKDLLWQQQDCNLILYNLLQEFNFNATVVKTLCAHHSLQTGKEFVSPTHRLVVNRHQYLVSPIACDKEDCVAIHSPEELKKYFKVELLQNDGNIVFPKNNHTLFIPADRLQFPIVLRPWKHGDYFYPLGGKGKQKLSDFFINQKISKMEKSRIKLFCIGHDIVWIVGYRSDKRYKIHPQYTRNYYKISCYENL